MNPLVIAILVVGSALVPAAAANHPTSVPFYCVTPLPSPELDAVRDVVCGIQACMSGTHGAVLECLS